MRKDLKLFGEKLGKHVANAKMTHQDLADEIGRSKTTATRLINGQRPIRNPDLLHRICKALPISEAERAELFELAGHSYPKLSELIKHHTKNLIHIWEIDESARALSDIAIFSQNGEQALQALWKVVATKPGVNSLIELCSYEIGRVLREAPHTTLDVKGIEIFEESVAAEEPTIIEKFSYVVADVALHSVKPSTKQRAEQFILKYAADKREEVRKYYTQAKERLENTEESGDEVYRPASVSTQNIDREEKSINSSQSRSRGNVQLEWPESDKPYESDPHILDFRHIQDTDEKIDTTARLLGRLDADGLLEKLGPLKVILIVLFIILVGSIGMLEWQNPGTVQRLWKRLFTPIIQPTPTPIPVETATPSSLSSPNTDAKIYLDQGDIHRIKGEYELAIADYTKAIELDPGYVTAYNNRGYTYDNQGKYELAIADYTKAIELDPDIATPYQNRGYVYDIQEKYELAIADFTKAIELDPDYATAYNNRGHTYDIQGEYELAIADYTRAIELESNYAIAYHNRGYTYYNQGEYELAIADYNKATELGFRYAVIYYYRGLSYKEMNNIEMAITDFERYIELGDNPDWIENAQEQLQELRGGSP